jgi:uroporphyrinogen-III decarboxylase
MLIVQAGKSGCVIGGDLLFYRGTAWPIERNFAMAALGVFLHALGGYVFNNVHNIQLGVPPENVAALFDAAYEYGFY